MVNEVGVVVAVRTGGLSASTALHTSSFFGPVAVGLPRPKTVSAHLSAACLCLTSAASSLSHSPSYSFLSVKM